MCEKGRDRCTDTEKRGDSTCCPSVAAAEARCDLNEGCSSSMLLMGGLSRSRPAYRPFIVTEYGSVPVLQKRV